MNAPTPLLYGLAVVVVLNIVESLFNSPATPLFRVPLVLAYVIGIVLFSKLGVWPALALWWGIGLVIGFLGWIDEFRRARHTKDADDSPPSLVTLVRGLFTWPITIPIMLLVGVAWFVVIGLGNLCYSLYKKLLPNHVPHYRRIEGCKEAAIAGDAQAQFTLGCAYESGEYGLPQDYVEAIKWFRKAAEQSHYAAQLRLGIYLGQGQGVEKNVVEGLMWIVLANLTGGGYFFHDAAHQAASRLKAQMTEQQIKESRVMMEYSPLYKSLFPDVTF